MDNTTVKKVYLWNVEWYANGEYQVGGRLTDVQINAITDMVKSFNDKNGVNDEQ